MKTTLLAVSSFLFALNMAFGQEVHLEDLYFENPFEKTAVEGFATDSNYFAVLLASSGRGTSENYKTYKAQFDGIIASLEPSKLKTKKPKKIVKKVFKAGHDNLFKRYQVNNEFVEVFETGLYNCVSSTGVYALMLEELNVDYQIWEEPGHVNLTAVFGDERIHMEGTKPDGGYYQITSKLIEAQLNLLIEQKLITEEDLQSGNLDQILGELFPGKWITIGDLLGIQYQNIAIYAYEEEEYLKSYRNAVKAYYFYPDEMVKSSVLAASGALLKDFDYKQKELLPVLEMYLRLDTSSLYKEWASDMFSASSYEMLFEENDPSSQMEFYKNWNLIIDDQVINEEVGFAHHLLRANYFVKKGDLDSSWTHSRKAFLKKSKNLDAVSMLTASIGGRIALNNCEDCLDTLSHYYKSHEILRENKLFAAVYFEALLLESQNSMLSNQYARAKKMLLEFEEAFDTGQNLMVSPDLIASVYGKLALHEFNRSKSRAQQLVKKGLELAPNHPNLLRLQPYFR